MPKTQQTGKRYRVRSNGMSGSGRCYWIQKVYAPCVWTDGPKSLATRICKLLNTSQPPRRATK